MRAIYSLLILLILIAGCTQAPQAESPQSESKPAVVAEIKNDEQIQKSPAEAPPVSQIDTEVQEVLSKQSKVKSYRYLYSGPPNDAAELDISSLGSSTKVTMTNAVKLAGETYYDTVYINTETQKASAYCERLKGCRAGGPYEIDARLYSRPLPEEFTKGLTRATAKGEELLDNRKVLKVEYETEVGKSGLMWLEKAYGIPTKVTQGDLEYEYRSIQFNSVTEQDMVHQA